jgi:hypothetical protein
VAPAQPTAASDLAPRRVLPPGAVEPPSLPEDPIAAKHASAQWDTHLDHEEEERQMFFDRPRLPQHRTIQRTLKQIRARYDKAKTEQAVEQAREDARRKLEDVGKQVHDLDPWGVNSRLLPDYAALQTSLGSAYADARLAAVRGDANAFARAKAGVDPHFKSIERWLEEVADEDREGEEH